MKKVISLLLATTFLMFALASCGDTSQTTTNPTTDPSVTTDASGTSGNVVKPSDSLTPGSIEFEPVTSATDNAIAIKLYKENIKNLVIGDTYTDTNGTVYTVYSVGIGAGYKVCADYAYSLETLVVNEGKIKKIEGYSFQFSTALTTVRIGNGVEIIGDLAFFGCSELESVTPPETLTTIGPAAFNGTAIKEIVIPASVTTIGQEAFANCTSLTKVTMPSSFNDEVTLKSIFLSNYKNIQFTFVD